MTILIFNPHSHAGSDLQIPLYPTPVLQISIHTPRQGATPDRKVFHDLNPFQSTLPMRGATFRQVQPFFLSVQISIHTPHAGSDPELSIDERTAKRISIHTPHAGSDHNLSVCFIRHRDFNPHSPCGERPDDSGDGAAESHFNPHSPCGERLKPRALTSSMMGFQSTLPMQGATCTVCAPLRMR